MNILCFDIGGTYIEYGIVNVKGELTCHDKFPTPKINCNDTIPSAICEQAKPLIAWHNIACIGISTAGQVNHQKGDIVYANDNLPNYTGCMLSSKVAFDTGLKVYVENDAHCAALGETHFGAGKNAKHFFCLTLGTGVGGAIILNRKLYKGANHSAGAIGYLPSQNDCVDKTISTRGLLRAYHSITGQEISGVELFKLIKQQDNTALTVYRKFIDNLVDTIVNINYLFDPELIILGAQSLHKGSIFSMILINAFSKNV